MPIFECVRCNEMTYSASAGAQAPCPRCGSESARVLEGDFASARQSLRELQPGDHAFRVYDNAADVAPFCARFLTEGAIRGDHVVAAVQADLREAVSDQLADDVESAVDWEDPRLIYANFDPDRIAATYEGIIAADARPTRIAANLDPELAENIPAAEFARWEERAHAIVTDLGATAVCLYDSSLPPSFLDVGARRHGLTVENDAARRNERFEYETLGR